MAEELLDTKIGHFRVVEKIAAGGMGEVYEGYDETLQRKVALKRIKREFSLNEDSKARFLREARVLSQLGHPNICQIFDYLEGDDADFIVMELIEGRSLTRALEEVLDGRIKMRVAEQLAGVLVAAHEKGVIHRDLKPDNIMLADRDRVKVLDFGLSRQLSEEVTPGFQEEPLLRPELTTGAAPENDLASGSSKGSSSLPASGSLASLTMAGAILGTLGYMSPEQANGEVTTAASDMYSFGLVLQELFTGKPPVEPGLSAAARLEKAMIGETAPVTGVDSDLASLIGRLKSLEPAARPSAPDAAEKLEWISRKPQRRRRRLFLVAAMTALVVFGAAMTVQSIRATRAEKRAREEAETAKQVSGFLVDLFRVSDPSETRGKTITAREILDKGSKKIQNGLKDQPLVQAQLLNTMGSVYMGLGLYKDAEPLVSSALAIREKTLPPDHLDLAQSLHALASLYQDQGKYAEAEPLYKRALAIWEKALGPDDPQVAKGLVGLANLYWHQGRYAEAEPLYKRVVATWEKAYGPDDPRVAGSLINLALLYGTQGKYAEAVPLDQRALAIQQKVLGPDHPDLAITLNNLATLYWHQGKYAQTDPLFKRALAIREKTFGPDHPDVAVSLSNLANLYQYQGKYAEAEPLFERALAIREKALGLDHPDVGWTLDNLATLYQDRGTYAEAKPLFKRALAIREKALGPDHPYVATSLLNLARLFVDQGKPVDAEPLAKRALAIREKALGPESQETANALLALASCEFKEKKSDNALQHSIRSLDIGRELETKRPEDVGVRFLIGSTLLLKGQIEAAMGKAAEGQSSWKEAFSILEPIAKDSQGVSDQATYAQTLLCLGKTEEARHIVKRLLDNGYTAPDLLDLCREKGLMPKESTGRGTR